MKQDAPEPLPVADGDLQLAAVEAFDTALVFAAMADRGCAFPDALDLLPAGPSPVGMRVLGAVGQCDGDAYSRLVVVLDDRGTVLWVAASHQDRSTPTAPTQIVTVQDGRLIATDDGPEAWRALLTAAGATAPSRAGLVAGQTEALTLSGSCQVVATGEGLDGCCAVSSAVATCAYELETFYSEPFDRFGFTVGILAQLIDEPCWYQYASVQSQCAERHLAEFFEDYSGDRGQLAECERARCQLCPLLRGTDEIDPSCDPRANDRMGIFPDACVEPLAAYDRTLTAVQETCIERPEELCATLEERLPNPAAVFAAAESSFAYADHLIAGSNGAHTQIYAATRIAGSGCSLPSCDPNGAGPMLCAMGSDENDPTTTSDDAYWLRAANVPSGNPGDLRGCFGPFQCAYDAMDTCSWECAAGGLGTLEVSYATEAERDSQVVAAMCEGA